MPEIITGPGLLFAIGAKLANDVCGPTAKYLGKELASYTEHGIKNLRRIFERGAEKLGAAKKHAGSVPPRVLKAVLQEGYFCEDEMQAEYLGGILASSKSPISRDDRGVTYTMLLSLLSSYQIRTHYLIYSCALTQKSHRWPDVAKWMRRGLGVTLIVADEVYVNAMDFSPTESRDPITEHVFTGLEKQGLLRKGLDVITPTEVGKKDWEGPAFRYVHLTLAGIELFLWGSGVGRRGLEAYHPDLLELELPTTMQPLELQLGEVNW
jgi:hypothetical protein